MSKIKILTVFGTRPEVIKLAPFIKAVEADAECISLTCATTQQRDLQNDIMSFFSIKPNYDLNLMREKQDLFHITNNILDKLKIILDIERPDYVVVQGDTTTAFASALAAFYNKIRIVHIEAGLRTWNTHNPYPEEANRQLIARIASFHMAPTAMAVENLSKEGIFENVFNVGNTIVDALHMALGNELVTNENKVLITIHRRENFGAPLVNICRAIKNLTETYKNFDFIWPVHPNPNIKDYVYENMFNIPNLELCAPFPYIDMLRLLNSCSIVMSDSGGIQEEACILGKKLIVLRNETERQEVITSGVGVLVGSEQVKIIAAMENFINQKRIINANQNIYGTRGVAKRIVDILKSRNKK